MHALFWAIWLKLGLFEVLLFLYSINSDHETYWYYMKTIQDWGLDLFAKSRPSSLWEFDRDAWIARCVVFSRLDLLVLSGLGEPRGAQVGLAHTFPHAISEPDKDDRLAYRWQTACRLFSFGSHKMRHLRFSGNASVGSAGKRFNLLASGDSRELPVIFYKTQDYPLKHFLSGVSTTVLRNTFISSQSISVLDPTKTEPSTCTTQSSLSWPS